MDSLTCGAVFQQQTLQIRVQIGIDGQLAPFCIGHAFYHVAEGILCQLFEFRDGDCLLKNLHNQVFRQRYIFMMKSESDIVIIQPCNSIQPKSTVQQALQP